MPIDAALSASHMGNMAKVEIYSKFLCGFCARSKNLLASKGVEFEEFDITMNAEKRAEMLSRSDGGLTVPQIFINGQHVGGSDDLAALEATGQLDAMLAS
jgi:glutaredoxin 3